MRHRLVAYCGENGMERFEITLPPEADISRLVKFDRDDPNGIGCYEVHLHFFVEPVAEPASLGEP